MGELRTFPSGQTLERVSPHVETRRLAHPPELPCPDIALHVNFGYILPDGLCGWTWASPRAHRVHYAFPNGTLKYWSQVFGV